MSKTETTTIPTSSPYYDRLRSLHIQIDFTPINTPEYKMLSKQIADLENRARKKMTIDESVRKALQHHSS